MKAQAKQEDAKIFYWLGNILLEKGSIVLPGNWIRNVNIMPGHHLALREQIYERVRRLEFPSLPSRTTSSFLCKDKNDINAFHDKNNRTLDVLYEVEIIDKKAERTILDSELLGIQNMAEGGRLLSVNEMTEKARLYWQSADSAGMIIPEVLVESPIRIIKRVGHNYDHAI